MKQEPAHNAFDQLVLDLSPQYGAGEARSVAQILFEDAFGTRQATQKVFTPKEEKRFLDIRRRLLSGEPLQYILGQADFFGLKFNVNPAVLIPRQETEELVAWILNWLKKAEMPSSKLIDIGLGSGCIGVSLKSKRPDINLYGLEKSPGALALATENAQDILRHKDFSFRLGDILEKGEWANLPKFDVIVSNPPYVPLSEVHLLPERVQAHEPEMALFVEDADPLIFYRTIAKFALEKLEPNGALFFECNEFNATLVVDMLKASGFGHIELRKDLSGADRMIMAGKSNIMQEGL